MKCVLPFDVNEENFKQVDVPLPDPGARRVSEYTEWLTKNGYLVAAKPMSDNILGKFYRITGEKK